jgi:transposase
LITLEDPANTEVKLLSSIHVCENCGGSLALVGKVGDEPHYRTD